MPEGVTSATGAANRLLYDGTYFFAYDAEGNRIAQYKSATGALDGTATDITTYAWNEKNELTAVDQFASYAAFVAGADSTEIDYRYDAFGNMVSRIPTGFSGESAQYFVYDGANVALILNGSGGVIERELDGPAVDQVLASEAGPASTTLPAGTVDWHLADNQGTVRDVVRFNGAATTEVDHLVYDSSGQLTSQTNSACQPTFTWDGAWQDPDTGLDKMGQRWYDAVDSVFASQDPIGFNGGQTNLSEFCGNSPTNGTDPSGMDNESTGTARAEAQLQQAIAEKQAVEDQAQRSANNYRTFLAGRIDDDLTNASPFSGNDQSLLANLTFETNSNSKSWAALISGCSEFNNPMNKGGGGFTKWNNYAEVVSGVCSTGTYCCNTIWHGSITGNTNSGAIRIRVKGLKAGKYNVTVLYEVEIQKLAGGTGSFSITPYGLKEITGVAVPGPSGGASGSWPVRKRVVTPLTIPITVSGPSDKDKVLLLEYTPVVVTRNNAQPSSFAMVVAGFRVTAIQPAP